MKETCGCHMDRLRRVVPREKLALDGVEDGWGPLCQTLGKDVPDDRIPRASDGKAIEEPFNRMAVQGLLRWVCVGGSVVVGVGVLVFYLRS